MYYQATILNIIDKLKNTDLFVTEGIRAYLETPEAEELLTRNVYNNQLYRRGIEGYGRKIMEYAPYRPSTIKRKKRKGQPHTRVTLRDTGKFHENFILVVGETGFFIASTDPKTKYLVKKYGNSIFRLTNENFIRIVNVHIRKKVIRYLKRKYNTK